MRRRRTTDGITVNAVAGTHVVSLGLDLAAARTSPARSEEHTSELQSRSDLVCRLLLEKKPDRGLADRFRRQRPLSRAHLIDSGAVDLTEYRKRSYKTWETMAPVWLREHDFV